MTLAPCAHVGDVFVDASWRGRGVARRMVEHLLHHPQLAGLRRWMEHPGSVPAHASVAQEK